MFNAIPSLCRLVLSGTLAIAAGSTFSGEARAQAPTYVGTFALTNIGTQKSATAKVVGNNVVNTTPVIRQPWAAGSEQEWAFLLLPNQYWAIFNIKTGSFLTEGSTVGTALWTGATTQQWYLYPFGQNVYALVNVGSGKMLSDTATPTTLNGTNLLDVQWSNTSAQLWYLYFLYK